MGLSTWLRVYDAPIDILSMSLKIAMAASTPNSIAKKLPSSLFHPPHKVNEKPIVKVPSIVGRRQLRCLFAKLLYFSNALAIIPNPTTLRPS